jgi:hypothetical protein
VAAVWTVDREYDQAVRHMCLTSSGGDFIANLTLRLSPDLDDPRVTFSSAVTDPAADFYVPFVEAGVRNFVEQCASKGNDVGHLRVTLTAITIHPVDKQARRFAEAAEMAMTQAFEAVGVEL